MSSQRDGGLRGLFKRHLPDLMWVPVETWMVTGPGVPDSWYVARGGASGWVEHKQEKRAVTAEQSAFVDQVTRYGGRACVAVRFSEGDELRMYRGSDAQELARLGVRGYVVVAPWGHWVGGPRRWDWVEVRELLTL